MCEAILNMITDVFQVSSSFGHHMCACSIIIDTFKSATFYDSASMMPFICFETHAVYQTACCSESHVWIKHVDVWRSCFRVLYLGLCDVWLLFTAK